MGVVLVAYKTQASLDAIMAMIYGFVRSIQYLPAVGTDVNSFGFNLVVFCEERRDVVDMTAIGGLDGFHKGLVFVPDPLCGSVRNGDRGTNKYEP